MGISPGLQFAAVERTGVINVDEEGTEAAAATAVTFSISGGAPFFIPADHPFLFLIRDRQTGTILFQGRLSTLVDESSQFNLTT